MRELTLISGGARSGKSSYAVELAKHGGQRVAFVATGAASDEEMRRRIERHRASRPPQWKVFEEGKDVPAILPTLRDRFDTVIIDCIGLLISNLLADDLDDEEIGARVAALVAAIRAANLRAIVATNEVGSGVVPMHALGRRFRDLLGLANQMIAREADRVILMHMGVPVVIKDATRDAETA